jgi:DNA polymerase III subunit gamma/tau
MSYTALYREWRPKSFDDVVGQKHITVTLKNQIMNGRIAHAYLLCGTRGTGKTSTAKILAKAVNCLNLQDGEPCNECEMCKKINSGILIDVNELDAASNNGIDNIRNIIDDVQYPPREARYKVYIMDEVHMLSAGAVNAFLKTLEEPPKNVIFILATTDPQKLPVTILSRCQRYDFRRIKSTDIFERLRRIVKEQGIFADDRSLNLIARISDGAMRDALSVLDQAISMGSGRVEYDGLIGMLGLVTNENLLKLTDAVIGKNVEEAMRIIDDLVMSGKDVYNFIREMTGHMRNLMMVKVSTDPDDVLDMSEENIQLLKEQAKRIRLEEIMRSIRILQEAEEESKWTKQSRIYLELSAIKMCKIEYDTSMEIVLSRLNRLEEAVRSGEISISNETVLSNTAKRVQAEKVDVERHSTQKIKASDEMNQTDTNKTSTLTLDIVKKRWKDILEAFKARRMMVLFTTLTTGEVDDCSGGVITIKYTEEYGFNKQRLDRDENKKIVEGIISEVLKEKVRIKCITEQKESIVKTSEERLKEAFGEELVEVIDE